MVTYFHFMILLSYSLAIRRYL